MIRPLPVRKSRGGSQGEICDFEALFFGSSSKFSYMKTVFEVKFHVTIMIMMSHTLKLFLSGSLHFRIKFYCSDEDESSKLCCFCHQDMIPGRCPAGGGWMSTAAGRCPSVGENRQQQNRRTAEAIMMQLVNS